MRRFTMSSVIATVLTSIVLFAASGQAATPATDSAANFYKGKVLMIVTQAPAGSTSDLWARTLGTYLAELIGAKIAIKNETAGGGRVIENAMATTIKPDGLTLMSASSGTMWPAYMTGDPTIKFDITEFQYIGGVESQNTLIAVSPKGKIKTLDDLRKAKGLSLCSYLEQDFSSDLCQCIGDMDILALDGKIVTGFQGSTGRALALQQGDADGLVTSPSAGLKG